MNLIRSTRPFAHVVIGLAVTLIGAAPLRAQSFVEFGGGWNYFALGPDGGKFANGYNVRASVGQVAAPHVSVRLDLFTVEFDRKMQLYPPCAYPGCTHPFYDTQSMGAAGLTANVIWNVDSRGILYAIGGAGFYDLHGAVSELRPGVSAGAGIAVPVGVRLRAIVEARWHGLISTTAGPSSIVPITLGFRY
ncbi:MAG: hypothetical protein HY084_10325 [Gemmatimonadetes bacterium]|nr:hypothetical protein [Gemmatimonadota bacterium]